LEKFRMGQRCRAVARSLASLPVVELVALFGTLVHFPPQPGRQRLYAPWRVFWLFLSQVVSTDRGCQETVLKALAWFQREKSHAASPNTSAYCQARKRLAAEGVDQVEKDVVRTLQERVHEDHHWHARRVKIVDGTTLSMPDTPLNQATYPQPKQEKPGFPILRLVGVFSLATGALLALAWDAYRIHERLLFHRLWEFLEPGDVLLSDRGFCSFADVWSLLQRGVDAVMRNHQCRSGA
jgi:hypothetical protein